VGSKSIEATRMPTTETATTMAVSRDRASTAVMLAAVEAARGTAIAVVIGSFAPSPS